MRGGAVETVRIPPKPRIAVDTMGRGELVLLLHGLGGSRAGWRDVLPILSKRFLATAWDARGQGDSDNFEGPLKFEDLGADILRVLKHFGAARAHLAGQSLGGLTALDFYQRHPTRVASLTLAGCAGKSLRQTMTDAQLEQWLTLRKRPLIEGKTLRDIAPDVARNVLSHDVSPEIIERVVAGISANRRESYLKAVDALARYDAEFDLTALQVPTLFIVGEDDRVVAPKTVRQATAHIPNVHFEMVEGAGHLVHVQRPQYFSDLLCSFLCRL